MDKHHLAHYLIAGVLALGGGAAIYEKTAVTEVFNLAHAMRSTAHVWEPLSDVDAAKLTDTLKATGLSKIVVYCLNAKCDDIADDFSSAIDKAAIDGSIERSVFAPTGVSVGGPDTQKTRALADAIYEGTAHNLKPRISVETSDFYFISFGKR